MKSLVIDVLNSKVHEVEIKEFHDFLKLLACDWIDLVTVTIGKRQRKYDLYIDDLSLLRETKYISVLSSDIQPLFFNNVVIARHNSAGEQVPLDEDDIIYLKEHIVVVTHIKEGKIHPCLIDVNY